jgi:acetyl esterase/lipase
MRTTGHVPTVPGRAALAALVAMALTGCGSSDSEITSAASEATTPSTSGSTVTPIVASDVEYLIDGSEQLDVIHPAEPGSWPVVIVAHGGHQVRSEFADMAEAIASEGAVVFNVGWLDRFPFATAVGQVACAVRHARATAADYGGDPARVVLIGHSIGAFVSVNVALTGDDYSEGCVVTEGSALPDALVAYEGPYDFVVNYKEGTGLDFRPLQEEDPDLWHALNPYSNLGRNPDLVVRLIHGDSEDDSPVFPSVGTSVEFRQALAEAGYDVEFTLVEGAHHGSVFRPGEDAFTVAVEQVMELAGR